MEPHISSFSPFLISAGTTDTLSQPPPPNNIGVTGSPFGVLLTAWPPSGSTATTCLPSTTPPKRPGRSAWGNRGQSWSRPWPIVSVIIVLLMIVRLIDLLMRSGIGIRKATPLPDLRDIWNRRVYGAMRKKKNGKMLHEKRYEECVCHGAAEEGANPKVRRLKKWTCHVLVHTIG